MFRHEVIRWKAFGELLALIVGLGLLAQPVPPSSDSLTASDATLTGPATNRAGIATRAKIVTTFGGLPISFERNRGQADPQVDFIARGSGYTVFLTPHEAVLVLPGSGATTSGRGQERSGAVVLRLQLQGTNRRPHAVGLDMLPGRVNYVVGNDPARWRTNIPTYGKVRYQDVSSGIDLVYYGTQRQLEYDFIVRPGADPGSIVLAVEGAQKLDVDATGDLLLHIAGGSIRLQKPAIYQEIAGVRREIAGAYALRGAHEVGFKVAAYDTSQPLVIDPVLFYSTYVGGTDIENDGVGAIAVDADGYAYVTGITLSQDFPTTAGAFQATGAGLGNVFVTKLDPTGSALVYSTYVGGAADDEGQSIAIDSARAAYITGKTASPDFPTTTGAFRTTLAGLKDVFVTKLDPTGSALVYSTYVGGAADDEGRAIALDATGEAYVTGGTLSTDYPTTAGAFGRLWRV